MLRARTAGRSQGAACADAADRSPCPVGRSWMSHGYTVASSVLSPTTDGYRDFSRRPGLRSGRPLTGCSMPPVLRRAFVRSGVQQHVLPVDTALLSAVAAQWKQHGIELKLADIDFPALRSRQQSGDYDFRFFYFTGSDPDLLRYQFAVGAAEHEPPQRARRSRHYCSMPNSPAMIRTRAASSCRRSSVESSPMASGCRCAMSALSPASARVRCPESTSTPKPWPESPEPERNSHGYRHRRRRPGRPGRRRRATASRPSSRRLRQDPQARRGRRPARNLAADPATPGPVEHPRYAFNEISSATRFFENRDQQGRLEKITDYAATPEAGAEHGRFGYADAEVSPRTVHRADLHSLLVSAVGFEQVRLRHELAGITERERSRRADLHQR